MAVRRDAKRNTPTTLPDRDATQRAILTELALMAEELSELEARRTELYARRRELYLRGRSLTPPVRSAAMADAANVSDAALVLSARRGTNARAS
jgi:hypothetical protein